jgi:uncharacterized protein (UPF0332 family)
MLLFFKQYVELGKVRSKTPDPVEAVSLLEKSKNRLAFIETRKIDIKSAAFVFEDAYSAAREAAQSLMSLEGYKPYSHEATISFVREKHSDLLNESNAVEFDRLRQLRDDSEYRAVKISIQEAEDCILFAKEFVGKVIARKIVTRVS